MIRFVTIESDCGPPCRHFWERGRSRNRHFSADYFFKFFEDKVDDIRHKTERADEPTYSPSSGCQLNAFAEAAAVAHPLGSSSSRITSSISSCPPGRSALAAALPTVAAAGAPAALAAARPAEAAAVARPPGSSSSRITSSISSCPPGSSGSISSNRN